MRSRRFRCGGACRLRLRLRSLHSSRPMQPQLIACRSSAETVVASCFRPRRVPCCCYHCYGDTARTAPDPPGASPHRDSGRARMKADGHLSNARSFAESMKMHAAAHVACNHDLVRVWQRGQPVDGDL